MSHPLPSSMKEAVSKNGILTHAYMHLKKILNLSGCQHCYQWRISHSIVEIKHNPLTIVWNTAVAYHASQWPWRQWPQRNFSFLHSHCSSSQWNKSLSKVAIFLLSLFVSVCFQGVGGVNLWFCFICLKRYSFIIPCREGFFPPLK